MKSVKDRVLIRLFTTLTQLTSPATVTRNPLCHTIKSNPDGQAFICSRSHQDITNEVKKSFKPVVGVCRSGQTKIVVPIVVGVTFVGTAAAADLFRKTALWRVCLSAKPWV